MDTEEVVRTTTPYIPLMTLENFTGKLKATVVPPVIDSSLTQSMSGGMAGALMSALKFLGLVDANGRTRQSLRDLVEAHGTENWKVALRKVVTPAYKDIIGDLDLLTATPAMLESRFREVGKAQGQVLEKAVRFYLAALAATEEPISPLLKARKARTTSTARKSPTKARNRSTPNNASNGEEEEEVALAPGMKKLQLPLPGKQPVTFIVPADLTEDDWAFLKPIFDQYMDRLLKAAA